MQNMLYCFSHGICIQSRYYAILTHIQEVVLSIVSAITPKINRSLIEMDTSAYVCVYV